METMPECRMKKADVWASAFVNSLDMLIGNY